MTYDHDNAYSKHLIDLGHDKCLTQSIIDGFNAWYSNILPTDKHSSILDFGCGFGIFIEYLLKKGYTNIEGADSNPIICAAAAKKTNCAVEHVVDIEIFASSRNGKYDFINLKDVLEHIEANKAAELLSALRTMLKPDGKLVVSCPQVCGFTSLFALYNDYTHLKLFTLRSLKYVLRTSGFNEVFLISPTPKLKISASSLLLRIIRHFWFKVLKILYFIERPGEDFPPYLGDRIMVVATTKGKPDENTT